MDYSKLIDNPSQEKINKVLEHLTNLDIKYQIWYHPPLPTIEEAIEYWKEMPGTHCKNLFFRNHKGNKHYLVILECHQTLDIHTLEKKLKQGKLSFASPKRMEKYLGVTPGSVTPFGLINDHEKHVKVFIDKELQNTNMISFHPNDNRASVVVANEDFKIFLNMSKNEYEYI
ncbi:MAG: prolyl-tRNA synthetase associated domain-containing protein [Bacteroidia bacterium]|jgi:Ala-tRNA(Pro) deacylase|nr:prolyl-tRNA synthetase associated domain-containing protein [Bacteroidales bacterium]MDD3299988.1 prolyl-tRNA synthetase associated domain-containing protein [Bacteroidales bacterium]MDD3844147.1 prolyl-tRNA synthetase associated domain-containing protein [Bacteroidales bacterium]MDD4618587.1 prolyl-tRNA synthetase associated domain-containing protein [Bacteroidales bacterium]NCC45428.1 prolyl-tRNA synthetase associated domain-containing protein [Bacteroidia bacterium]